VINETLARRFFPGEDPIGQAFGVNPSRTVIGIAADLKNDGLAGQPMPEWILPLEGATPDGAIRVAVRTRGEGHLVAAALRQALRQMDPRMLATVHTMQERFEDLTAQPRFNGVLFAAFAAVALTLAVVGIYGVVSFAVASRTREIGIRMALGADGGRVMRLVMRDASAPVAAGIAAGMLGSVAGGRYLATLLYDIKTTDPLTLVAVAALLATVAVGASLVPALRASHIDPNSILRAQ
jgi:ABC-type antimicrobial peptide transport system permease subunit